MAIQSIRQDTKTKKHKGSSLLDKGVAAASLVGSFAGGAVSGGAAWAAVPAAAVNAQRTFANKGYTQQVAPGARPEVMSAMDRRSSFQQEDPLQSLKEAQAALAQTDLDPQTRQNLEAPILRALQSRGGMA